MKLSDLFQNEIAIWGGVGKIGTFVISMLEKLGIENYRITDSNTDLWSEDNKVESNIELLKDIFADGKNIMIITAFLRDEILLESMHKCGIRAVSWKDILDLFYNNYLSDKLIYYIDWNSQIKNWFLHLWEEIHFWEEAYAKEGARKHHMYLKCAKQTDFKEDFLPVPLTGNEVVLDIGCGILSRYGSNIKNDRLTLIPVDPLAYWYNRLNKKYLDKELLEKKEGIVFGMFEGLSYSFSPAYADVIIISNALDHCIDPFRSILECLKILKPGGTILLKHLRREAVNEGWSGLHQWNIDITKNGELLIWNQENVLNMSDVLKDCATIENFEHEQDERGYSGIFGFLTTIITKVDDPNECLYERLPQTDMEYIVKMVKHSFADMSELDYKDLTMWEENYAKIFLNNN